MCRRFSPEPFTRCKRTSLIKPRPQSHARIPAASPLTRRNLRRRVEGIYPRHCLRIEGLNPTWWSVSVQLRPIRVEPRRRALFAKPRLVVCFLHVFAFFSPLWAVLHLLQFWVWRKYLHHLKASFTLTAAKNLVSTNQRRLTFWLQGECLSVRHLPKVKQTIYTERFHTLLRLYLRSCFCFMSPHRAPVNTVFISHDQVLHSDW